jgi:hypothetical protein
MRVLLIITLAFAATACTRHDGHRVQQDLNATGQNLATAAHNTGQDPARRRCVGTRPSPTPRLARRRRKPRRKPGRPTAKAARRGISARTGRIASNRDCAA